MKKIVFIFALVFACLTTTMAGNNVPSKLVKDIKCTQTYSGVSGSITVSYGGGDAGSCLNAWNMARIIYGSRYGGLL